jgi:hypothetical protein
MSTVKENALKDPTYCPYCLRCPSLVRMKKVEPLLWKCHCGAVHDERWETEFRIETDRGFIRVAAPDLETAKRFVVADGYRLTGGPQG